MEVLTTEIRYMGHTVLSTCDRKCEKAWGVNGRRGSEAAIEFDDMDDGVYLADHEVGEAPRDPGTYEGGQGKPMHPKIHNKWCVRECERNHFIEPGEEIVVRDFSKRHYNQPWLHDGVDTDTEIGLGRPFVPQELHRVEILHVDRD